MKCFSVLVNNCWIVYVSVLVISLHLPEFLPSITCVHNCLAHFWLFIVSCSHLLILTLNSHQVLVRQAVCRNMHLLLWRQSLRLAPLPSSAVSRNFLQMPANVLPRATAWPRHSVASHQHSLLTLQELVSEWYSKHVRFIFSSSAWFQFNYFFQF